MPLSIATNAASLNAQRTLSSSSTLLSRSLQRLSSGLRINSAQDDAAGLAISTRMTTQIRGMSQAVRNANDGLSMLQTAEGSMETLNSNLQRIRELAVQSANASNSASDRAALAQEVDQRLAEIDRIGKTATFNGQRIFAADGSSIGGNTNQRAVSDALRMGWLENAEAMVQQSYGLQGDGADLQIEITSFSDGQYNTAARVVSSVGGLPGGRGTNLKFQVDMADFTPPNLPDGGSAWMYNDRIIVHEMVHAVMARSTNWESLGSTSKWFVEGAAEFIHGADERVVGDVAASSLAAVVDTIADGSGAATWASDSDHYSSGYVAVRYLHDKLKSAGFSGGVKDFMTYLNSASAPTMNQALDHFFGTGAGNAAYVQTDFLVEFEANGVNFVNTEMNLANTDTGAIGGLDADGGSIKTQNSVVSDLGTHYGDDVLTGFTENWEETRPGTSATYNATLQIGANVGETSDIQFGAMSKTALGLDEVDVATSNYTASRTILHIDQALEYLSKQRAALGAQMSRMESTISNLQVSIETASTSNSRIVDADYASETAQLTRAQILRQAGVAISAQANSLPRNVLRLLGA
ncbi:MAG: hypothetical protein RLZZ200_546 [Pseudomonadota bacterium]|jgi:flagellin